MAQNVVTGHNLTANHVAFALQSMDMQQIGACSASQQIIERDRMIIENYCTQINGTLYVPERLNRDAYDALKRWLKV